MKRTDDEFLRQPLSTRRRIHSRLKIVAPLKRFGEGCYTAPVITSTFHMVPRDNSSISKQFSSSLLSAKATCSAIIDLQLKVDIIILSMFLTAFVQHINACLGQTTFNISTNVRYIFQLKYSTLRHPDVHSSKLESNLAITTYFNYVVLITHIKKSLKIYHNVTFRINNSNKMQNECHQNVPFVVVPHSSYALTYTKRKMTFVHVVCCVFTVLTCKKTTTAQATIHVQWSARSPDLSPLDFFLWGTVRDSVYQNILTTPDDMEQHIR
ncbi:hypothetical protein ANN_17649 [Periplaneta americana]|uniref:Uncharacterized protein n=1 Tax=Periplaneta americana TaxID=6978 RepID=A0ABQ8STJ5_PERAM|nr:hypothetical protein ANN_17649 [Periplaneta americana]